MTDQEKDWSLTVTELLDDLDDRIDRGITALESMACDVDCAPSMHSPNESLRLRSKAEGLHLVHSWLSSYRPSSPENVDSPKVSG